MEAVRDWFTCPRCAKAPLAWSEAKGHPVCAACGFAAGGSRAVFDLESGEHKVQTLLYNQFLKCFYNPVFGEEYSTLVNYDWYHPRYAYRYRRDEVQKWFDEEGLTVTKSSEIEAQMFFLATKG